MTVVTMKDGRITGRLLVKIEVGGKRFTVTGADLRRAPSIILPIVQHDGLKYLTFHLWVAPCYQSRRRATP